MIKTLFLFIISLLFIPTVFGCSIAISPISDFDEAHYIFTGEIVGIIENPEDRYIDKGDVVGFKVKVSENIYSPKKSTFFEVFPFRLTAGCGLASDVKKLREQFPVGSKVRVVAKEATPLIDKTDKNSVIRLETSIFNRGSFSRNDLSENLRTSAQLIYDYSGFTAKQRTTPEEDKFFESNYYLPEFELRKDLLCLKETTSEDKRALILERLVFYPHIYSINFLKIVRDFIKNEDRLATFEALWKNRIQEFKSKQH